MVKTTVTITPSVYRKLRELALEEGSNVRTVIRRALDDFLKRRRSGRRLK